MSWQSILKVRRENYDEHKHEIRSGDIILCSGSSLFSNLIKKFTGSKWSHVGFILKIDKIDRIMVMESVESIGVRAVTLSSYLSNYNGSGKPYPGEIVIARHKDMKQDFIDGLSEKAVDLLGHQYDKNEIIRITARLAASNIADLSCDIPQRDNEYICSEYVDECYRSVGVVVKPNCGFISPGDFANDEKIYPVFSV